MTNNSGEDGKKSVIPAIQKIERVVDTCLMQSERLAIYLEAGHYDPREGPTEFSVNSLNHATRLLRHLIKLYGKRIRVSIGILVDDLGLECDEESCSISEVHIPKGEPLTIPDNLIQIFAREPLIKPDRIMISSERAAKNRAIKKLRSYTKDGSQNFALETEEAQGDFKKMSLIDSSSSQILLAEYNETGVWRAKCPAIMGRHYSDRAFQVSERFPETDSVLIIDWSEMIDKNKVEGGREAFIQIFSNDLNIEVSILNIFYGDQLGELVSTGSGKFVVKKYGSEELQL